MKKMSSPTRTEVIKSGGKTVFVNGLRVFEHTDGTIRVASSENITYCPKGSPIEKFFKKFLEK